MINVSNELSFPSSNLQQTFKYPNKPCAAFDATHRKLRTSAQDRLHNATAADQQSSGTGSRQVDTGFVWHK